MTLRWFNSAEIYFVLNESQISRAVKACLEDTLALRHVVDFGVWFLPKEFCFDSSCLHADGETGREANSYLPQPLGLSRPKMSLGIPDHRVGKG